MEWLFSFAVILTTLGGIAYMLGWKGQATALVRWSIALVIGSALLCPLVACLFAALRAAHLTSGEVLAGSLFIALALTGWLAHRRAPHGHGVMPRPPTRRERTLPPPPRFEEDA